MTVQVLKFLMSNSLESTCRVSRIASTSVRISRILPTIRLLLNPDDKETYLHLGISYHKIKNDIRAIESLKRYLNYDHKSGEAHYYLARIYERTLKLDKATDEYNKSIKYSPNEMDAYYRLGMLHYNNSSYRPGGTGGTQSAGGTTQSASVASSFGLGASSSNSTSDGIQGGGGGGGSGYIGGVTSSTTIAGNASMPDPDGGTMTGREDNGLVVISWE